MREYSPAVWGTTLLLLGLVPLFALGFDEPFYIDVCSRIIILAIAVISLDLLVGFGGMVSFGHAAYLGIGSYAVGICSYYGVQSGAIHFSIAIIGSAFFAFIVGLVSLRVRGAYFIMITLAFPLLVYFLGISLKTFGGDDGMVLYERSMFVGIDLYDNVVFYYFAFGFLVLVLFGLRRLTLSRFGVVLNGIRQNEKRMAAVGFNTFRYRLVAFVIAGAICGVAGALLANQTEYFSPAVMHWSRSGDLLVMAIIGGVGTLLGSVFGTFLFVVLELVLSAYSKHWHLVFGPFLVIVALATHRGLLDLKGIAKRFNRKAPVHGVYPVASNKISKASAEVK